MSNNILQPVSPDFNTYLRENAQVYWNSQTPAAPSGNTNVTFQFDAFGNASAYSPNSSGSSIRLETNGTNNGSQSILNLSSGTNVTLVDNGSGTVTISATGAPLPSTTNLIAGNGTGGGADSTIAPSNVTLLNTNNLLVGSNDLGTQGGAQNTFVYSTSNFGGHGVLKVGFDKINNNILIDYQNILAQGQNLNLGTGAAGGFVSLWGQGSERARISTTGGFSVGTATFNGTDPGAGNVAVQGTISATSISVNGNSVVSLGGTLSNANVVVGAGAGSGGSATLTGVDGTHLLTVTTGTLPTLSASIAIVTFTSSRGHISYAILEPANAVTAALSGTGSVFMSANSATAYTLSAGTVALAASTTYVWNVVAI